ncbi:MAG: hypothetical protein JW793_00585 [Acidobacteria bacterium]|nr:hypothetical protein [Acidobacteriota bacterium]
MKRIETMTDAERIAGKFKRIRRRLFLVRLAGSAAAACCLFGITAVLFTFESLRFYRSSGLWLGLLGAGLTAAAIVFSFLGMPSWKETVRRVDRNLNLRQRLVTAWECTPPREEIDRLLVRDAARRLSAASPASALPLGFHRTHGILLAIGLLFFTALSLVRLLDGAGPQKPAQARKTAPIAADGAPETGETSANKWDGGASPDSPDSAVAPVRNAPAVAARAAGENPESAALRGSSATSAGGGTREMPPLNRQESYSTAFPFRPAAPGDTGSAEDRSRDLAETEDSPAERMTADAAKITEDGDSPGSSSPGIYGRKRASDTGGAATGARHAQDLGIDAGNAAAAGKTVQPAGVNPEPENIADPEGRPAPDYPSLRLAAERALAREKIPPGLRKYVADYFRAIQP